MALKMSELREKDVSSLQNLEKELTENLFAARLQKRTGQLENTAKISLAKRDLARVKTVLRARALGLEVIETPSADKAEKTEKKAKTAEKPRDEKKPAAKPAKGKAAKASAKPAKKTKAAAKPAAKKAGKSAGKKK